MSTEYELYKEGGLLNHRYQKLEDISKGAYGIVSLAKDLQKQRLVAVKYIFKLDDEGAPKKQDYANFSQSVKKMDSDVCEEALHEIAIHEKLGHHKNIIEFVDCFNSFIILEYCSRGDLYEAIQADIGPSSTRDIVNVMLQLIEALEYAHSQNIYHRDIKPENILIADDWTIRLSDWGLASKSRYCNDFGIGSERYMAPELFDEINLQVYDAAKVDVWSTGICLLNLIFKKSPFTKACEKDKSFTYFACNREALFDIFSTMSMDLFTVLRYSLAIDPDNRDLGKMKEELLNVQSLTIDDDLELMKNEIHEAKPMNIGISRKTSHQGDEKIFATQTPNINIADQLTDFRKDLFNRKDFFTPPSDSAQFLHNFSHTRKAGIYQPPHQRPTTPKSAGHLIPASDRMNRPRRSFNSFSHHNTTSGKYVPPNLRSPGQVASTRPSQLLNNIDAVVFEDDDEDAGVRPSPSRPDEDDMFVLEESADLDASKGSEMDKINHLVSQVTLDDDLSDTSSAPSLIPPIRIGENKSRETLTTDSRNGTEESSRPGSANSNAGSSNGKHVYVPPHHRQNYQSQWNQIDWNNFNHNYNIKHDQKLRNNRHNGNFQHHGTYGRRYSVPASMSTSVPTLNKTNWFPFQNKNAIDEFDDDDFDIVGEDEYSEDDNFEGTEMYKKFASRVGEFAEELKQHGSETSSDGYGSDLKKRGDIGQVGL